MDDNNMTELGEKLDDDTLRELRAAWRREKEQSYLELYHDWKQSQREQGYVS
jgi:hypothetical protein